MITVITPTVQRQSLIRCCESVNAQSGEWQHIVMVDSQTFDSEMMFSIAHPRRLIRICGPYRNGGNTPRHFAWEYADGEWVIHLDDDNYLASPTILAELASALEDVEDKWALVPIHRHGSRFYFDPPKPCYFDTGNAVVRREIAQWPNIDDYASDGVWLTETLLKYPYKAFPNMNPVMVMPSTSFGAGGGINGQ